MNYYLDYVLAGFVGFIFGLATFMAVFESHVNEGHYYGRDYHYLQPVE